MTEPDSRTHVDEIRAGVLGALLRNMSIDYAARADGLTVAQAEEIARAAGWPDDMTAVMVEHRRLKGVPVDGRPAASLIGPVGVDTRRVVEQPAQVRPRRPGGPRPDLSVARVQAQGLRIERKVDVRLTDGELVIQAEREYRGEVVQAGPTPEHREPLESYVARYIPDHPQSATCGTVGGRCGPTEEEAAAIEEQSPVVSTLVSAGPDEIPQPDAVTPDTPPSPMPAEYYGRDPSEPSPEDEAELDEQREFLTRHGLDDDPAEGEPLVWDRTELIEEEPLPPATDDRTEQVWDAALSERADWLAAALRGLRRGRHRAVHRRQPRQGPPQMAPSRRRRRPRLRTGERR